MWRSGPLIPLRCFLSAQDAKKDDAVRKAYKYLAALHEVRGEARLGLAGEGQGLGRKPCLLAVPRTAASSSRPLRTQAPSCVRFETWRSR